MNDIELSDIKDINFGVTYSEPHCRWLFGASRTPQSVLREIVFDLEIKNYRLEAYWKDIQKNNPGELDTSSLDWQLKLMEECKAQNVILCLGRKVPHWPEYHLPEWTRGLPEAELKEKLVEYIARLVGYFADDARITAFQVENEIFYKFGLGKPFSDQSDFLGQEIDTVRKYDKLSRQIIVTQSGDMNNYTLAARDADILGLSYYGISFWKGFYFQHYWLRLLRGIETPQKWLKKIKSQVGDKVFFLTELQAEPWLPQDIRELSMKDFNKSMNPAILQKNIKFVVESGFKDIYFGGPNGGCGWPIKVIQRCGKQ